MKKIFLIPILLIILITSAQSIIMKRVCFLQAGQYLETRGNTLCWDTDHNGLNELIFATGTIYPSNPLRWEIWEYRPFNRYELVFADTGAYPFPPGITTGNFRPYDVGDIDRDSLTDLLGPNEDVPLNQDTLYYVVTTQESPDYSSYPEDISWWYRYSNNFVGDGAVPFYFPGDLDQDTRKEIFFHALGPAVTHIFENIGNNQNELVLYDTSAWACSFTFGDFDLDDRKEFVTAWLGSLGRVFIYENTGDNQYELICVDTVQIPNGHDVFSGNDLDSDGQPEFFVGFARIVDDNSWNFYLYMWEATGNNTYERTFVFAQRLGVGGPEGRRSKCADIDGDGIEELIWASPINITVYEAIGNNQFQPIWQWWQDHGTLECLVVNSYDMNQNGYNEIVVGGSGKTSIFEVEAIRVLRPNGGETFQGNTYELIRWQKFYPPRCDSLSLFYSIDNGRTYDTIITGIPGTDTSYLWTVPETSSDSCKVKIIAFGPGWQFDESAGVFRIIPVGIEENISQYINQFRFEVLPNPSKGKIKFKLWGVGKSDLSLNVYNLAGELVKTFSQTTLFKESAKRSLINHNKPITIFWDGADMNGKILPAGVYFLECKLDTLTGLKKVLLLK